MHDLRLSSLATHPTFLHKVLDSSHSERSFLAEALDEIRAAKEARQGDDETDFGFDERIRVDEIGKLLEGQEHHVRCLLAVCSPAVRRAANLPLRGAVPRLPPSRRPPRFVHLGRDHPLRVRLCPALNEQASVSADLGSCTHRLKRAFYRIGRSS